MIENKCKALILDSDSDALLTLQRTLENSGVDTTITWDNAEARNLIRDTPFTNLFSGESVRQRSEDLVESRKPKNNCGSQSMHSHLFGLGCDVIFVCTVFGQLTPVLCEV